MLAPVVRWYHDIPNPIRQARKSSISGPGRLLGASAPREMDLNNAAVFHLEQRIVGSARMTESRQSDTVQAMTGREFDFQLMQEHMCLFRSERLPRLQELDRLWGGHSGKPNINASVCSGRHVAFSETCRPNRDRLDHFPRSVFR